MTKLVITEIFAGRKSFQNSYKRLAGDLQDACREAIADLLLNPLPKARRFHALCGYRDPKVFTVDVTSNHSHKLSFEIQGTVAVLRRVGTHTHIDRAP